MKKMVTPQKMLLLLLCLILTFSGCSSSKNSGSSSNSSSTTQNQTLTVSQSSDTTTLDPQMQGKMPSMNILINMFDTLVTRDNNNSLAPSLATSWKAINDTTWQFKLRTDVKFTDGEPFNADVVKYSIERLINPATKSPIVELADVKEVDVVDESTVNIVTKIPDPIIPNKMVLFDGVMVPPQYIQAHGAAYFALNPVGTGPFEFVSWTKDSQVVMKANPDYWRGAPSIKNLIIRTIPNAADAVAALKTGEVDIAYDGITGDVVNQLKSYKNVKIVKSPWIRTSYIDIDTTVANSPLANQQVRQALNYAIDVPTIISTVLGGNAKRVSTIIPSQNFGYDKTITPYTYDTTKAKQLLAQAGYPNGFSVKLDGINDDAVVIQALVAQFAQAGIKITMNLMDSTTFAANITAKKVAPLYLQSNTGWTMDALSNFQSYIRSDRKYNRFPDSSLDHLVDIEEQTINPQIRQAAFTAAQQSLKDEAPFVYLYQKDLVLAMGSTVDWSTNATGILNLYSAKKK